MTSRQFRLIAVGLGVLALALIWGCSDESTDDSEYSAAETDRDALVALVGGDSDVDDVDAWSAEDAGGGSTDELISPINWARIGHRGDATFEVEIAGDTAATITRTRHWDGTFRLITDTTGGERTRLDKPMYNVCVRKTHAIRVARTRYARLNWRITEITPETLASAAPNPHTVTPLRLQVTAAGENGPVTLLDLSDPLSTYLNRESVVTVGAGQELTIYATANTSDPAYAVIHPFVYRGGRLHRAPLHDDGIAPDILAGDGVYSGLFAAPQRAGLYHAAVDLLDWETMFDSEGAYDAGGWSIPYRVVSP